jgi:hypothetical protein
MLAVDLRATDHGLLRDELVMTDKRWTNGTEVQTVNQVKDMNEIRSIEEDPSNGRRVLQLATVDQKDEEG